ncbi:putative gag-pol fusion protein [Paratrimastix pyriformis]|uniref:Gag-pol fusion protein n=1 Tax=Paratrimastix pyriformis TaxID=342808 RepID=A0ABQ8U3W8_9EUKA|nr:putative gag-pol fusion protein [Paratrimastix pyriformis]
MEFLRVHCHCPERASNSVIVAALFEHLRPATVDLRVARLKLLVLDGSSRPTLLSDLSVFYVKWCRLAGALGFPRNRAVARYLTRAIRGELGELLEMEVSIDERPTLQQVYHHAGLIATRLVAADALTATRATLPVPPTAQQLPQPARFRPMGTMAAGPNPTPAPAWRPPLTKLTDDERRDLIARGICTRCRQPGHDRFHCPLNSATPSPWPRGPLTPATPLLPQPAPQPSSTAGPTPSPSPSLPAQQARAPFVFQSARPPPPPRRSDRQHQPPTRFSPSTSSVQTQDDLPHSVAPTQGGPVVQPATPAAEVSALAATLTAASDLCPAVPAPPGVKGTVHLAADGRAYVEDRGLTFLLDSGSNVTLTSEHYALAKGLALTEEPQPRTVALANKQPVQARWSTTLQFRLSPDGPLHHVAALVLEGASPAHVIVGMEVLKSYVIDYALGRAIYNPRVESDFVQGLPDIHDRPYSDAELQPLRANTTSLSTDPGAGGPDPALLAEACLLCPISTAVLTPPQLTRVVDLLLAYRDVFGPLDNQAADVPPFHVELLDPKTPPVHVPPRRYYGDKAECLKREIKEMTEANIIVPSLGPYHQVPVDQASRQYLSFTCSEGTFSFCRMPFGIATAAGFFQQMIQQVMAGVPDADFYQDDAGLHSATFDHFMDSLEAFLSACRDKHLRVKGPKSEICPPALKFVGMIVDGQGYHVDPDRIKALHAPGRTNIADVLSRLSNSTKPLPALEVTNHHNTQGKDAAPQPTVAPEPIAPACALLTLPEDFDPDVNDLRPYLELQGEPGPDGIITLTQAPESGVLQRLFALAHNHPLAGHVAAARTLERIARLVTWPGMRQQISDLCSTCALCQKAKARPSRAPELGTTVVARPYQAVYLDHLGPLPPAGDRLLHVLVMIDRFSRWVEAVAVPSVDARTTTDAFFRQWICRHGPPETIVSDGGTAFTNATLAAVCQALGVDHHVNVSHHPQSHGVIERLNRTLLSTLRILVASPGETRTWADLLPSAVFALNTAQSRVTRFSPFEVLHGFPARTPLSVAVGLDEEPAAPDDFASDLTLRHASSHPSSRPAG